MCRRKHTLASAPPEPRRRNHQSAANRSSGCYEMVCHFEMCHSLLMEALCFQQCVREQGADDPQCYSVKSSIMVAGRFTDAIFEMVLARSSQRGGDQSKRK